MAHADQKLIFKYPFPPNITFFKLSFSFVFDLPHVALRLLFQVR